MIYNDQFVWLHFPKCAGTKIAHLFKRYFSNQEGLHQDKVGLKDDPTMAWHDAISQRRARSPEFDLGERIVVCSFRKLIPWLESRFSFEFTRSPDLDHHQELLLEGKFIEQNGKESHADLYARKYLPKPILNSGRVKFIRTEYFESDFKSIFGNFLNISKIPDSEYSHKMNISEHSLSDDIRNQLYENQTKIYEKCPYWKMVEELAYGG